MYINDDFTAHRENDGTAFMRSVGELPQCSCEIAGRGCGSATKRNTWGIANYPPAMVYSPMQEWRELYDLDTALNRGTIFKELDLPFVGCRKCGVYGGGRND